MAKQLVGEVKFQVPGGQATPAPPVGTALGRYGINLGQFVSQFNDRTKDAGGMPIPVVVKVYNDRTFEFATKSPPAAALLKQAAGIAKGSGVPNKEKVGKVTHGPGRGDLQTEDGRPQCPRPRPCPAHGRGHRAEHGLGSGGLGRRDWGLGIEAPGLCPGDMTGMTHCRRRLQSPLGLQKDE